MATPLTLIKSLFSELQRRGVFQVAAVYAAATFVLIQAADLVFPVLPLPEKAYGLLVLAAIAGFPIALLLAWFFDLTAQGVQRASHRQDETAAPVNRRSKLLSIGVLALLVISTGSVAAIRAVWASPKGEDGRIAVAVFPFRPVGTETAEWSEGIADLLATALDGTEGVRVVDPWSLWSGLRREPGQPATSPDPVLAAELARGAGARRVVLGSAVAHGAGEVELTLRLYDPRFPQPIETFAMRGQASAMPELVQRLAVEVIARVWDERAIPSVGRLEPNLTRSADALKAYLAAKIAMRQGRVDSAVVAIDRAIALDSTFALALVDAVGIRTWHQFMQGQPFSGFFELLQRALAHDDSLSERNRLRLEAMQASIETDGRRAAKALRRIIEIDSTDLAAWSSLSYVHNVYGWQYGVDQADILKAADRVVALDSSFVPGLAAQTWIHLGLNESTSVTELRAGLMRSDTTVPLVRRTLQALTAVSADDAAFEALLGAMKSAALADWLTPYRYLRFYDPARAGKLLVRMSGDSAPGGAAATALFEYGRLRIAEGRSAEVEAEAAAGRVPAFTASSLHRVLVANALAGLGDAASARRAADALARATPIDSALAHFSSRPVWWTSWLIGAYHAQLGDTAVAHAWRETIGQFPAGGSPKEYRAAMQADIEARLAIRRGQKDAALAHARRAYDLWSIHTENQPESMPEPAIRFNLAMLLRQDGQAQPAELLLKSLTPPASWMGFYTARASFELGEILSSTDPDRASRYYSAALRLWQHGGPEMAVWRRQVETRLRTLEVRPPD